MGCQQSRDEHMALHPSHTSSAAAAAATSISSEPETRQRLSLSQLLLQHSKQQDANASHRDVFSIFGERGMVLERVDDLSASQTLAQDNSNGNGNDTSSVCFPPSPVGSVFSTATTASDSERTQVLLRRTGQSFPSLQLRYGAYSDKGLRKTNEDRHVCASEHIHDDVVAYFGVYDGHGGARVAEYLAAELHTSIFERMRNAPRDMTQCLADAFVDADDAIFQQQLESGSTAVAVLIRGATAVVASVGDSQAVLCTRGKARNVCAVHTPNSPAERARILAANGKIDAHGRIFGFLGVSRAFGDNDFKTGKGAFKDRFNGDLVIATPEIVEHAIDARNDEFLVLASDGLFDVMTPQVVVDLVRRKLAQHGNAQHASEELVSHALSIGSMDNVSAVVVCFNHLLATASFPAAAPVSTGMTGATVAAVAGTTDDRRSVDAPLSSSAPAAVVPLAASMDRLSECKEAATGTAVSTSSSSS